jgi:DNA-binding NarL/FixJ family response regulator
LTDSCRISVFCVDDNAGFRAALCDLIAGTQRFVLIGQASSGSDAIALVPRLCPDLVLMDVRMPGMSGFEAATLLAGAHGDQLIVLMSADPIEVPRGFELRRGDLAIMAKHELSPSRLLELWLGRRAR